MKFKELQGLSTEELQKKEDELSFELMKLNSQVASGTTPKNPSQIRNIKKNIAKIKTLITQQK
ncbi:MAG: 50S ribosomal protein L29 [Nanoarchaeota archaeon]